MEVGTYVLSWEPILVVLVTCIAVELVVVGFFPFVNRSTLLFSVEDDVFTAAEIPAQDTLP